MYDCYFHVSDCKLNNENAEHNKIKFMHQRKKSGLKLVSLWGKKVKIDESIVIEKVSFLPGIYHFSISSKFCRTK